MSQCMSVDQELDLKGGVCPYTFAKANLLREVTVV